MRKLKGLGIAALIVGLAVLPGYELGSALSRLHASETTVSPPREMETIGTYEVNPETMEGALRLHRVSVVNAQR
jgi:hypothetical protein